MACISIPYAFICRGCLFVVFVIFGVVVAIGRGSIGVVSIGVIFPVLVIVVVVVIVTFAVNIVVVFTALAKPFPMISNF